MKPESCVFRSQYFADRYKIGRKSRLQVLAYRTKEEDVPDFLFKKKKDSILVELHSEDVENAVDELESMGLLSIGQNPTCGGDAVYSYHPTERGVDRAERLIQGSDENESIETCTRNMVIFHYLISSIILFVLNLLIYGLNDRSVIFWSGISFVDI
jgi:hypothetical protein